MRHERPPCTMTGPCLITGILEINMLRNKYDVQKEKTRSHTPNEEDENFVNAYLEVAAEFVPAKQRRKSRVPWETLAVREKRADVKKMPPNAKGGTQPILMP